MAPRVQVPEIGRPRDVSPAAGPVRRFVVPQQPEVIVGPTKAEQLSSALTAFNPQLTRFLKNKQVQVDEQQVDKARAMRLQTALNYKEAVNKGIITPDQNPFFIQAWKEQDGRVAADQFNADLQVALSTGPFASSVDPKESEGLFNTFRTAWIKEHGLQSEDRDVMVGFGAQATAYEANARSHQAAAIGNRIVERTLNNTYFEVKGILDEADSRTLRPEAIADGINHRLNTGILIGLPPQQLNGIVLDAIAVKAKESQSMEPFQILDHIKTGSGVLAKTKEAVALRLSVEAQMADSLVQTDRRIEEKARLHREQVERDASASVWNMILSDDLAGKSSATDKAEVALRNLAAVDVSKAESLRQMIKKSQEPRPQVDVEGTKQDLFSSLFKSTLKQSQVNAAFDAKLITAVTAKTLSDELQEIENRNYSRRRDAVSDAKAKEPDYVTQVPAFRINESAIAKAFGAEIGMVMADDKARLFQEATNQYWIQLQSWHKRNPEAPADEQFRKASEISKQMIDSYLGNTLGGKKTNEIISKSEGAKVFGLVETPTTQRHFAGAKDWEESLVQYRTDKTNSKLGKIISSLGLKTPEEILKFIEEQEAIY